jgi:hypothetical protein
MTCMTSSRIALVTRRIVAGSALGLAALTTLATPASAAGTASRAWFGQPPSIQQRACTLDGFVIDRLPGGLGSPTDFQYEWEDVVFHSRVWETGPDPEGATKVDLTMKTIRGEKVIDLETLREFLTEYHEKDPDEWKLTPLRIGSYGGYAADDQAFFFVSPGVAAEVSIDRSRYSQEDLLTTAAAFYPENVHPEGSA